MRLHSVRRDQRGQAIVEYVTIVALIGACLVAILGLVGSATRKAYDLTRYTVDGKAQVPAGGGVASGGGAVRVIPASAPASPDSVEVGHGQPEDPDSGTTAHASR